MEHIVASYALGRYYRTDRGSNPSQMAPKIQENYDATIFYYERAAKYIEASANNYPYNTHTDVPDVERKAFMSVENLHCALSRTILQWICSRDSGNC